MSTCRYWQFSDRQGREQCIHVAAQLVSTPVRRRMCGCGDVKYCQLPEPYRTAVRHTGAAGDGPRGQLI